VPVEALGGLPGVPDRKGLKFGIVRIEGRFEGFVFQGDEPDFSSFNVKLISDHKLRQELNLSDGDSIRFELIE
jgi:CTP-dependent riboflavin kinase